MLLAQSEVINNSAPKDYRSEQEIQVKDDSILFPFDIIDSYWTLDQGQLALNKYYRNDITTKVFSLNEKDVKEIKSEEEQEKIKVKEKIKSFKPPSGGGLFNESDEEEIDVSFLLLRFRSVHQTW